MKVVPRSPEAKMPTCKGCFYSREIGSETAVACHRYPPTITKAEDNRVTSHFPLVGNDIWCGEYRVNGKAQNKMFPTIPRKESRK